MEKGAGFIIVLLIASLILSGCIEGDIPKELPLGGSSGDAKDTDALIDDFEMDDYDSMDNLDDIIAKGEAAIPPLKEELKSEDPDRRWGATYAIGGIGFELDPDERDKVIPALKDGFDDEDPRLRQLSAGLAASFGDKSGLPILIEYLDDEELTFYAEPPEPYYVYSITVLRHYTGQDFGYDMEASAEENAEAIGKWWGWWNTNGESLSWVPGKSDEGRYIMK